MPTTPVWQAVVTRSEACLAPLPGVRGYVTLNQQGWSDVALRSGWGFSWIARYVPSVKDLPVMYLSGCSIIPKTRIADTRETEWALALETISG